MIYLASPYSHSDEAIQEHRFKEACRVNAMLLAAGRFVYSPIVHCHPMADTHRLPTDYQFWKNFNHHMIERSSAVYFLLLPEWQHSKGMLGELQYADMAGKGCYAVLLDVEDGYRVDLINPRKLSEKFSSIARRI